MLLSQVFNQQCSLYSVVIILFHQTGNNSRFVCLNDGFMTDVKGQQTYQCPKMHQIVKPFVNYLGKKEAGRLRPCCVAHKISLCSFTVFFSDLLEKSGSLCRHVGLYVGPQRSHSSHICSVFLSSEKMYQ